MMIGERSNLFPLCISDILFCFDFWFFGFWFLGTMMIELFDLHCPPYYLYSTSFFALFLGRRKSTGSESMMEEGMGQQDEMHTLGTEVFIFDVFLILFFTFLRILYLVLNDRLLLFIVYAQQIKYDTKYDV